MSERYELLLASAARRALTELPPVGLPHAVAAAVTEFITGILLEQPYRVGKPLINDLVGHYSARRGSYRVIYSVDDATRRVHVRRISHRATAYR